MANVLVNEQSLSDIAAAIREKNGEATTYKPGEMAAAISNLPTGSDDAGNWDQAINPLNSYAGLSKHLTGTIDTTARTITFDLSSKIKPWDYNWILATAARSGSDSTKYLLTIHCLTTVWPKNGTEEVEINNVGIHFMTGSKSVSSINNVSLQSIFPYALYIKAYYNPSTCILRIDYSQQLNSNYFGSDGSGIDKNAQLIYRPTEEE